MLKLNYVLFTKRIKAKTMHGNDDTIRRTM